MDGDLIGDEAESSGAEIRPFRPLEVEVSEARIFVNSGNGGLQLEVTDRRIVKVIRTQVAAYILEVAPRCVMLAQEEAQMDKYETKYEAQKAFADIRPGGLGRSFR